MSAHVTRESTGCCTPIFAFVAGVRTLAGMHTLVHSKTTAGRTPIVALIAGEWTLARMNALVLNESAAIWTSILALVTCIWPECIARADCWPILGQCILSMNRFICYALHFGQLAALEIGRFTLQIKVDGFFMEHLQLERCLDGAHNHILPRPQIAREFSLERQPNAARGQLFACADSGANAFRDGGLESLVRNLEVD